MRLMNTLTAALAPLLAFGIVGCSDDTTPPPEARTVLDVAAEAGTFNTLIAAVDAAGLTATLEGDGPFTVFAPTDDAFALLPAGVVDSLLTDTATLADILTYHVVADSVDASAVVASSEVTTIEGGDVAIAVVNGNVILNGTVQVTATDIVADNGIIHVIDAVMLPQDMDFPGTIVDAVSAYPMLDTLKAAVIAGDLAGALSSGTYTVFGPTNDAFAALPAGTLDTLLMPANQADLQNILQYHVVAADVPAADVVNLATAETLNGIRVKVSTENGVMINGANVTWTDITTSNGTIHIIDSVLLPPGDIVAEATAAGAFSTLITAVTDAGLAGTLTGPGPFTVFAPTDDAFAAINATGDLTDVLLYHVIDSYVDSKAAIEAAGSSTPMVATLSGVSDNEISLRMVGDSLVINEIIQVTSTDVVASNGIIHVIDAVMLPSSVPFPGDIVAAVSAYPIFDDLVGAVVSADLVAALQGDNMGQGFTLFAPTAAAFEALGIDVGTLPMTELEAILLYHVVSGTVDAGTVVGLTSAPTLQGTDVSISVATGSVVINDSATVVRTDIYVDNGVIHVIDAVLMP